MNFLRNLLAAIIGCLIAFGILFIMFFIFASLVGSTEETVSIKENSILELQLNLPISDYVGNNEADPFTGLFEQSQGLDEILHAIETAKDDEDIKGVSINAATASISAVMAPAAGVSAPASKFTTDREKPPVTGNPPVREAPTLAAPNPISS